MYEIEKRLKVGACTYYFNHVTLKTALTASSVKYTNQMTTHLPFLLKYHFIIYGMRTYQFSIKRIKVVRACTIKRLQP